MRTIITAFLFLLISCYPQKKAQANPEDKSTKIQDTKPCKTPSKTEAISAKVDTPLCRRSISQKVNTQATSLILASYEGDVAWVEYEIQRGADVNKRETVFDATALTNAAFDGSTEIAKLLLEAGADPNIPISDNGKTGASDGSTPLTIATTEDIELVRLLLEHGADPDIPRSDNGKTGASDGSTPLIMATSEQDIEIVKLLLEHGADPNIPSSDNGKTGASDGSTPLTIAASKNIEIVRLLLEHGADPSKARSDNGLNTVSDGSTPLLAAVATQRVEVVQLLLAAGADPDKGRSGNGKVFSADGATPLQYAAGQKIKELSIRDVFWKNAEGEVITRAHIGDTVYLCARLKHCEESKVHVEIWEKDFDNSDDLIEEIKDIKLKKSKLYRKEKDLKREWTVVYVEDDDDRTSSQELEEYGYTLPEYYFVFRVKDNEGKEVKSHSSLVLEVGCKEVIKLQSIYGDAAPYKLELLDPGEHGQTLDLETSEIEQSLEHLSFGKKILLLR